jgi:hypothetical protein
LALITVLKKKMAEFKNQKSILSYVNKLKNAALAAILFKWRA